MERINRLLDALASQPAGRLPVRLCAAAAKVFSASGAGIAVVSNDVYFETVAATGSGLRGEELQLTLGEGPAYDAYRHGQPILVDDLANDGRWPMLGANAVEAGIAAMFAFPLRSGAVHFGACTLYRDTPEPLGDEQYRDALVFARLTLDLLMSVQGDQPSDDLHEMFKTDGSNSWKVHQATGMVSAQQGISMNDALAMLRGHAFATGSSLGVVAAAVVAGTLLISGE